MQPEDIGDWRVRNGTGDMTPVSEIVSSEWNYGASLLQRYNGSPALNIQGQPAPGESSGVAMDKMEELVSRLPDGTSLEWTGISAQERSAGNQSTLLYLLSGLFVFLCLAALYESWTVPISVLLVAPVGMLGAVVGAHLGGYDNDVFFQVGLLTTVGLASKNAILIVEFARALEADGKELIAATIESVRLRFRPILMTSLAFGLGTTPLVFSSGAGAASRAALGTTVLSGMIAVTFIGLFAAPLFYVVVRKLTTRTPRARPQIDGTA
jgi:HAE1 family hydrophobic/amphiphilic exporter-1/multidrug efflux pump